MLLESLKNWGADVSGALERFSGDETLYLECLSLFVADDHFSALAKSLATKNYNEAFEHIHSIKGVAGNMGLNPMYKAACELGAALSHEEYNNLAVIHQNLHRQIEIFKKLATETKTNIC